VNSKKVNKDEKERNVEKKKNKLKWSV